MGGRASDAAGGRDRDAVLRRAETLIDLRRPLDAVAVLGPWVGTHPDDPEPLTLLGRALIDADRPGDAAEARRLADRALALDPESARAWWLVSLTRPRTGEALDAARRTATLSGGQVWARSHLVRLALRHGSTAEADELARALAAERPNDPEVLVLVGDVRAQQRRPEDAAAAYRSALAIDPDHVEAQRWLASVTARGRGVESAAAELARLRGRDPADETTEALLEATVAGLITRLAAVALGAVVVLALLAPWSGGLFGLTAPTAGRPLVGLAVQQLVVAGAAALAVRLYRGMHRRLGGLLPRLLHARLGEGPYVTIAVGFLGASMPLAIAGVAAGAAVGGLAGGTLLTMALASALASVVTSGFLTTVFGRSVRAGYGRAIVALVLIAPAALLAAATALVGLLPFCIGYIVWDQLRRGRERRAQESTA